MADWTPLVFQISGLWVINERIFHTLKAYLQPNATLSPVDVAQEIDKLFPLNRPREGDRENEDPESFLWEMWELVIAVAAHIPWTHPGQTRLVEVIQALRDLPGSKVIYFEGWGDMELWAGLSMLGPTMTDTIYAQNSGYGRGAMCHGNFIAFSACLTQSGVADRSKYFAIPYFRDAFEVEPDPRSRAYLKQGPHLDDSVPLVGLWIFLCGTVIFAHCRNPPEAVYRDAGRNWKGANRYSIERWNFWKKRLGEIKDHDQPRKKTKKLAAKVEERMNRIESEAP